MKSFFRNLFSCFSQTASSFEKEGKKKPTLEQAVRTDNVPLAYELLSAGADPNEKILYTYSETVDGHFESECTGTTCLLKLAASEPMKRLLQHFGALPLQELERRWEAERQQEQALWRQQEKQKRLAEEQKLAEKAAADNRFLDTVLKS